MADKGKPGQKDSFAASSAPLHCGVKLCKTTPQRFGFCSEHFEQYKFGLINKSGVNVPDYEKKLEHYKAFKAKKNSKVA